MPITDLSSSTPIADSDIPAAIARDSEVAAAINAHVAAVDLHSIRFKIINFTAGPPSSDGSAVQVAHGIDSAKILGFSVAVQVLSGFWVGPNYFLSPGQITGNRFLAVLVSSNLLIENYPGDSANIVNKPGRAIIWYLP